MRQLSISLYHHKISKEHKAPIILIHRATEGQRLSWVLTTHGLGRWAPGSQSQFQDSYYTTEPDKDGTGDGLQTWGVGRSRSILQLIQSLATKWYVCVHPLCTVVAHLRQSALKGKSSIGLIIFRDFSPQAVALIAFEAVMKKPIMAEDVQCS